MQYLLQLVDASFGRINIRIDVGLDEPTPVVIKDSMRKFSRMYKRWIQLLVPYQEMDSNELTDALGFLEEKVGPLEMFELLAPLLKTVYERFLSMCSYLLK